MPTIDGHPAKNELPRFILDVDMYIAKYAYAISVVSGEYTALQVQQLDEWLNEARRMVLASGASLDGTFYCMCQDEAADIVVSIRQHVQERRDGYEILRAKWPEWKEFLQDSVQAPRGIRIIRERPTEIAL
jgi:hypothetical protein